MTTLYKPVLIETVEQAEALPINTLAISADGVDPAIRKEDGWHGIFGDPPYSHAEMVSDYALMPIETEEETGVVVQVAGFADPDRYPYAGASMDSEGKVWFGDGTDRVDVTDEFNEWANQYTQRRYATRWEPAP